jgi:glycosyltransferase involved in cell wall biosynthesis
VLYAPPVADPSAMAGGLTADSDPPRVSVVIPCFNEEAGLPELRSRIESALGPLDGGFEVIVVDDGSTDRSFAFVERWSLEAGNVVLVKLSRNFGMEIAMTAGLDYARGEFVILMHADLQDPPELVPEMLERATAGADVVYARRIGRDESFIKRALATAFYELMRRLARVPYQGQAGDFRLMSRRVVDAVRAMPERRRFLRGMVAWVGYEQVPIEYRRAGRRNGRGASYPALLRLAFEALSAFSDVPLAIASWFGMLVAGVSAAAALVIFVLTLAGAVNASLGLWVLFAVLFLGGVQLVSVGILGRYLARVHAQVLERPMYLIDRVVGPNEGRSEPALGARRPAQPARQTAGNRLD